MRKLTGYDWANIIAIGIIVIVAILAISFIAEAQGEVQTLYPSVRLVNTEGELVFEGWFVENDDMSCIQMSNGNFFCCCGTGCSVEVIEVCEGDECYKVTPTPPIPPTDTPDEQKCNRGIGNDSEGCDPGNSSGQGQGAGRDAGEDRDEHKKDKKDK